LAYLVFYATLIEGALTMGAAARKIYVPGVEALFVGPLVCVSVAALGVAVRAARVRIDGNGIRWGWNLGGFRMSTARLKVARVYRDGIALVRPSGSAWFLARRDWAEFSQMSAALASAGLKTEMAEGRAPLRARLQAYGRGLDILLLLTFLGSGLLVFVAVLL
jgi:hypothetical protein